MALRLEQIQKDIILDGIVPGKSVKIIDVVWYGSDAIEIAYKLPDGDLDSQLLYRGDEDTLNLSITDKYWTLDAHHQFLTIASEAYRIQLAHLFDPRLAVHTSLIQPLPHQITAVYSDMLTRQPLRFLLADDPGAGKTIMAGLLIKELIVRGDVKRCLVCAPGSLTEQWQDELWTKFKIRFEILTRDKIESSHSGNPFQDYDRLIVRLDQVSRNEELKAKLAVTDWDLIICDEAHKMSASFFGNEVKETKRHKLGKILSEVTRHFLLMTATPHNGKEEDFQLFMSLIDNDRFEGKFRDGVHVTDTSDIMRRMVKEDLLKFDGRPLFPERMAYTVDYQLSVDERILYDDVTEYVREEFNRADKLQHGGRKGTIGFALTILQRRLASSPEAIYQSLHRRRKRLEKRLKETEREKQWVESIEAGDTPILDEAYLDEFDDFPDAEFEELEIELVDSATAAQTIVELEAEIETLKILEGQAAKVRRLGTDRKWEELADLMQSEKMFTPEGSRRKIVIFTEHRDTLDYLYQRLSTLLGTPQSVVMIHGGVKRSDRQSVEHSFRNDPDIHVLLATDAAGEGINLQRAHLMVNYDLPWNPNRLEQRFGRIHRIGQEEVCHLWNLVSSETREGHVYRRLLQKLEVERHALGGKVFDVLGRLFREDSLRALLMDAIRYGDQPEVRAKLDQAVDNVTDQNRIRDLLEEHALVTQVMDTTYIDEIRAEMERASARRLQPHYIKTFFLQAFELLGGQVIERERGRFQINRVPAIIRDRAKDLRGREIVPHKYERICFEKDDINVSGKPQAEFVCPGHLLLDSVIDLIVRRYQHILQSGTILIDPNDYSDNLRGLFYLEHTIRDARTHKDSKQRVISRDVRFVEMDTQGNINNAGYAPYLDYREPSASELKQIKDRIDLSQVTESSEMQVRSYAIEHIAPNHLQVLKERREELIDKTMVAVQQRLTKEINYWDRRANELKAQQKSGKKNIKLNWQRAQQRANELAERLENRQQELNEQRQVSASPPVIVGRTLVIPIGMLTDAKSVDYSARKQVEMIAMQSVMAAETAMGHQPTDVSHLNVGYDIESVDSDTGRLRFLEVKGRNAQASSVTVSNNEIITGLNAGENYALVIVLVDGGEVSDPYYIWNPPFPTPNQFVAGVNLKLDQLLAMNTPPQ
jgi:SNF2 family DNA or RNA helicase